MAPTTRGRDVRRNFNSAFLGFKNIEVSVCNMTVTQAREMLLEKSRSTISELSRTRINSWISLLDELSVNPCLPFEAAYQEYAAKISTVALSQDQKSARVVFRHTLLSKSGLPVIIAHAKGPRFVCLQEKPLDFIPLWKSIDKVLDTDEQETLEIPSAISAYLKTIMNLMSSAKDRAILQFVLGAIYSNSQLRYAFGYTSKTANAISKEVQDFITQAEIETSRSTCLSESEFSETITKLANSIEKCESMLERKRKRLCEEEIDEREFDIGNKKRRLNDMHQNAKHFKSQFAKKHFSKWKNTLKVQSGKKLGKYTINRGAERAIYSVLAEQLKAHRRRWGDEGTGYIETDEERLHKREMRRIANKYLAAKGLPLIKSTETVRSWGRPRNKSSRQAKQHRGQNLWAFVKSQKKSGQRHVNVHYNRAHIKHYTRLAFGKSSVDLSKYVVRRAMDDKAYVRCGTSEGFSRPLHRPIQPATTPFEMPSSDYPDTVGYVSPGVILLVNEMEEVEHQGRDKFTPTDVTVTVTCNPKHVYPSSATNWANDMFSVWYCMRKEHEVESFGCLGYAKRHPPTV